MGAFGRAVSIVALGSALACGRSVRDDAVFDAGAGRAGLDGGDLDSGPSDTDPTDGPSDAASGDGACGAARPLCAVDRCADGECTFVEIARLPEPVWGTYSNEDHVYAIAEQGTSIFRVPKCGGEPQVIVRTVGNIDGLAISRDLLYWTVSPGAVRRLYRMVKDGSGPAEELTLEGRAPDYSSITADETGAYVIRSESPGIVRYEATALIVLAEAPVRSTLLADREFLYTTNYDEGTRRVKKLDGSSVLLLDPGALPVAADERALYYVAYDPPDSPGSRPSYVLNALPKDDSPPEPIRYLDQQIRGVSDGRCLYLLESHSVTGGTVTQTLRLRLDGGGQSELWSGTQQHSVSLSEDTCYLAEADGSIYRRPK
jgi:hypothetical protein